MIALNAIMQLCIELIMHILRPGGDEGGGRGKTQAPFSSDCRNVLSLL